MTDFESLKDVIEIIEIQKNCMKPENSNEDFKNGAYTSYVWVLGLLKDVKVVSK